MPGEQGNWELLYTCEDTGNTGYVGWEHLRKEVSIVACHIFKHRRWGIIQPSCLCVGLPGTLEEARARASLAFVSGGQVDISDDLATLPEDRWQILTSVLPPLGMSAKPIDLFDPIVQSSFDYEALCRGISNEAVSLSPQAGYALSFSEDQRFYVDKAATAGEQCANVWHLCVNQEWDRWNLVTLFNLKESEKNEKGAGRLITSYYLPLDRIGLNLDEKYWAYEFWSGQFLGEVPVPAPRRGGYTHPGDTKTLIASPSAGILEVSFFGPAVKHLIFRKVRKHPWVIATSFHMSGGAEIENLCWNEERNELSGELHRSKGEQGFIVIASALGLPCKVEIAGRQGIAHQGSHNSIIVPVNMEQGVCPFRLKW